MVSSGFSNACSHWDSTTCGKPTDPKPTLACAVKLKESGIPLRNVDQEILVRKKELFQRLVGELVLLNLEIDFSEGDKTAAMLKITG